MPRPPASDANHKSTLSPVLLISWKHRYKLEVPLGLTNVLEQLTEFRATFYLLNYWFIIKGYNSETARWKRYTRQGMWEGRQGFHAFCRHTTLPKSPFEHQSGSSPNPVILGFYIEVFFTLSWFVTSLAIGDWPWSPALLPSLEVQAWVWKFPTL